MLFTNNYRIDSCFSEVICIHCSTDLENDTEVILLHCKNCPESLLSANKLVCFKCEYRTPYSGTMRRHIRAHVGDKPYKCLFCTYRSNQSSNLMSHINLIHTKMKKRKEKCTTKYRLTESTKNCSTYIKLDSSFVKFV